MSRKCFVCSHPKRHEIDKSLVKGKTLREITRSFGIDKSALYRHKQKHLPKQLLMVRESEELTRADNLWDQIEWLRAKALSISRKAEEREDYRAALAGIRELVRIVELTGKLRGDLSNQPVNIILSPQWIELRTKIVTTLEDFPDAKAKLAEVLGSAS